MALRETRLRRSTAFCEIQLRLPFGAHRFARISSTSAERLQRVTTDGCGSNTPPSSPPACVAIKPPRALTTGSDRALGALSDDVRFKNELTPLRPKNGAADGSS